MNVRIGPLGILAGLTALRSLILDDVGEVDLRDLAEMHALETLDLQDVVLVGALPVPLTRLMFLRGVYAGGNFFL